MLIKCLRRPLEEEGVPGPHFLCQVLVWALHPQASCKDHKHFPVFHMRGLSSERLGALPKVTQQAMVSLTHNLLGWINSCPIAELGK